MPPTPHLRISPAQRSDQKRPSPAPARGFLCPQISPPPPMKRPGTPLLFILSNQPPPQQKNTAPPDETSPPPKLPHPSHHLLPDPIGPLFLCPAQPSSSQQKNTAPPDKISPRPRTSPPFPPPTTRPGCLPHFTPAQPASFPAERCRPSRWASPPPQKLSYPSQRLLPNPATLPFFYVPSNSHRFFLYIHPTSPKCGGEKKNRPPPQQIILFAPELFCLSATPPHTPLQNVTGPKIEKRSCPGGGTAPFGFFWVHFELFWVGFGLFRAVQR